MRRRLGLSDASKILARGASSSPPPSLCLCPRMTPTTPTRSTMSTLCSALSGRGLALAPQGRPPHLDRSKVNRAWFLSAILTFFYLSSSLLLSSPQTPPPPPLLTLSLWAFSFLFSPSPSWSLAPCLLRSVTFRISDVCVFVVCFILLFLFCFN